LNIRWNSYIGNTNECNSKVKRQATNTIEAPVLVPVNVCGNTVNIIGLLNPAFGNTCINK
jgi:hypothetical protein